jgi:glycosyltransferase involved in cell wall biosynthesis
MLGYSNYLIDPRIKKYVRSLESKAIETDIIVLKAIGKETIERLQYGKIHYLGKKYRGNKPFKYILNYLWFFTCSFIKLSYLHIKNNYDVIHVHNMPNFLVFAAIVPKILGARVLLDVHDVMTALAMVKFSCNEDNWLVKLLKIEQKLSAKFADHVICADHFQRDILKEFGIPEEKISVIMNGVYKEIFQPARRKKKNGKFNIIYHGTIAERFGIDLLLRAVATIKDQIPLFLYIYGEGDFLEECLALRKDLALQEAVYFNESLFPYETVPDIMDNMDVGIIPNKNNLATNKYMLPSKLMEYMHFQIAVIAPRLQIIEHYFDETMIKFYEPENIEDLSKCILDLYENHEKRISLIKSANKVIEQYNWDTQAKDYLELIL